MLKIFQHYSPPTGEEVRTHNNIAVATNNKSYYSTRD